MKKTLPTTADLEELSPEACQSLESVSPSRAQFIATLSHELKTPLAAMLTQTQSTLRRRRSAKAYQQTLELCERNLRRMSEFVQRMLDVTVDDAEADSPRGSDKSS